MLIKELKDKKYMLNYMRLDGHPIGVLLAVKNDNVVNFGWSMCGFYRDGTQKDIFKKERGQFIAFKRAMSVGLKNIPSPMVEDAKIFIGEAMEHFKDASSFMNEMTINHGLS